MQSNPLSQSIHQGRTNVATGALTKEDIAEHSAKRATSQTTLIR
jgi:hypothetical protein